MLNKISRVFTWTVTAVLSISAANASDCGCPEATSARYVPVQNYQSDVIYPSVKNYDCSSQTQVYTRFAEPVYQEVPVTAQPQPAPQAVRTRRAPEKVYHMASVDEPKEHRLVPVSQQEVERRGRTEKTYEYKFSQNETPKAETEFVMSSRSERQKVFEGEEETCRDGSIFGGGPCKRKDKNGSIFGGGPCKNCTKNGSIFGGGPCKNCTKNGSIFGGGPCKNCAQQTKTPCQSCKRPCRQVAPCQKAPCRTCVAPKPCQTCVQPVPAPKPACVKKYEMQEVVRSCKDFAPLSMEWVDFRIVRGDVKTYSRKLGNYRFRIFGCRRNTKNAILNEGRIVEKDMNFGEIFKDMVSDCYTIVNPQQCIDENSVLPEYVLTAEITDYFMNVCDEYNWDEAKMENSRNGSSEMKVTWRLMDASKTNVLWKGESTGYGEVEEGEYNGEMLLIQRAFADAADNLRYLPGFEDQLAVRVSPEEMQRQKQTLMEIQRASGICQFKVVEDFGAVSGGYVSKEGWIEIREVPVVKPVVETEVKVIKATPVIEMKNPPVVEDSGINESAIVSIEPVVEMKNPPVTEDSGVKESGVVAIEYQNPPVTEDSGVKESGVVAVDFQNPPVTEDSGVKESGVVAIEYQNPPVTEDSGVKEAGVVAVDFKNPPVTENSGVVENGVAAVEPVATGAIYEADKLCIVERADYANLSSDTIEETRKSIVSITNSKGKKGAGLLISEQFVMTSADLLNREDNSYTVETSGGKTIKAKAFRLNPHRNTALLVLSEHAEYAPLALTLELPPVAKGSYVAPTPVTDNDKAYLNNTAKVSSYRYTPDGIAEIVVETFNPKATIGTSLIDEKGRVAGLSHRAQDPETDLFLPMETAMRSLGVEICGKAFPKATPKPEQKVWRKPVSSYIDNPVAKTPEAMPAKNRK